MFQITFDLQGFERTEGEDVWCWNLEENGNFLVNSMYKKLEERVGLGVGWGDAQKRVFGQVWKSLTPSKVVTLSWKLLLNRIPT